MYPSFEKQKSKNQKNVNAKAEKFCFLFCPVGMSVYFLIFVDLSIFVTKFSLKTLQELLLDFGQNLVGQETNFDCISLNEKFQINQT